MAETTSDLSASIQTLAPSENWDDDFEFQPSSSTSSPRKTTTRPRQNEFTTPISARLSVASSHLTEEDWDAESMTAGPSHITLGSPTSPTRSSGSSKKRSAASKSSVPPALARWVEEDDDQDHDLASPSRRLFSDVTRTENWDDDFEDRIESPTRPAAARKQGEESWDEEFGLGPPPRRRQTPRKLKSSPLQQQRLSNGSLSSDDDAELGLFDDENQEDKTVTAHSKRSAIRRPSSPSPAAVPPPPVPTFLSSSPNIPVFPSSPSPFPAPRSPTSSVFSVPTTVGGADARSYTSTTYLRATTSRSSSGHGHGSFSHLPPSPPIHKARERRRLRKKSRPAPNNSNMYEMQNLEGRNYPYAYRYSFSDGELEEIRDVDEDAPSIPPRTPSPRPPSSTQPLSIPVTPGRSTSNILHIPPSSEGATPGSFNSNSSVPVPATPSSRAGALLSRIGSVTRKGWPRRKRGSSISTGDNNVASTGTDHSPPHPILPSQTPNKRFPNPVHDDQRHQLTPRPRSSLSSLHHSHSRSSSKSHRRGQASVDSPAVIANAASLPPPPSNGWFFRSTSNTSGGRSSLGGYGGGHSRNGSLSDLSAQEQDYQQTCLDNSNPGDPANLNAKSSLAPVTPSKLIKRKSLGFVQLRRGFGGHNGGENDVVNGFESGGELGMGLPSTPQKAGKRPMSMAVGDGKRVKGGGQPRHASFGTPKGTGTKESDGKRDRKKSLLGGRARSGSRSSINQPTADGIETDDTDYGGEDPASRSPRKGKEKVTSSLASGVRAFMGNVRRLSIVGGRSPGGEGGTKGSPGATPGKHKRTKSGAPMPVKSLIDPVSLKGIHGSRSGTPNSQHARPLTPSTSYPHLSSAMSRRESQSSTLAKREAQRRRSGSRTESRAESRNESRAESRAESRTERSRPSSRSGLSSAGSGNRALSPTPTPAGAPPSTMSSRQASSASSMSVSGSISSVPMPPPIPATIPSGRRRSGSASSSRPSSRSSQRDRLLSTSTVTEDTMKTPRPSKIQYYPSKAPDDPPPVPLLPPIELHPPSPPRTSMQSDNSTGRYQSLGDAASDSMSPDLSSRLSPVFSPPNSAALNSASSGFTSSTGRSLSPIMSIASPSASPKTVNESSVFISSQGSPFTRPSSSGGALQRPPIDEHPNVKPSLRAPASPGQLQSASLGRSAVSSVVAGNGSSHSASGSGGSSATGTTNSAAAGAVVPRRNSLGDLKIPARISQAQSSLRRDLGMVREFAGHVEHMKTLQSTYDALVNEIHVLLDKHAAALSPHYEQQPPRTNSPGFFNNLVENAASGLKFRRRSYTSPEGGASSSEVSLHTTFAPPQTAEAKAAYKELAITFRAINSKYQISWECADLLVELGSGSTGGGTASATESPSKPAIATGGIAHSASASASTTAIVSPAHELGMRKNRERAITLAGDESRPSTPTLPSNLQPSLQHRAQSQPQQTQTSHPNDPPVVSPNSWRASTGRHDLSQRQLTLLKEMLNNSEPGSVSTTGTSSHEKMTPSTSVASPLSSGLSPLPTLPSTSSLNVNKDWRWGNDPMSSTVTLPSEEESLNQSDVQQTGGQEKKRRLTMSGFRDMLRALRKGGGVIDTSATAHATETTVYTQRTLVAGSTASLSVDGSVDGQSTRKRPRSSGSGLDRIRGRGARSTAELSDSSYGPSQAYAGAKLLPKSPRRPSLASIFKIGIGKSKQGAPKSDGGSAPESAASSRVPSATSTDHENMRQFIDGGEDGATEHEEEDWDQIDSASDLDGHEEQPTGGKPYGNLSPLGAGDPATIRGSGKRLRKPNSPYLQQDPYASRSTSGVNPAKRSANSSQVSLYISSDSSSAHAQVEPQNDGVPLTTPRPFRLSKVQESHAESPVFPSRVLPPSRSPRAPTPRSVSGSSKFNTTGGSSSFRPGRPALPQPLSVPSQSSSPSRPNSQGPPALALTPENIKPLLENAREVQLRLNHCIAEVQALLDRAKAVEVPLAPPS